MITFVFLISPKKSKGSYNLGLEAIVLWFSEFNMLSVIFGFIRIREENIKEL